VSTALLLRWGGNGFWAIVDQAAFALSNFTLSLLLARWLTAEEYGAFAVSSTVFFLLGSIHAGLFVDPMLVFGQSRFRDRVCEYISILECGHWYFSAIVSLLFILGGTVAWLAGQSNVGVAFVGTGLSSPFILFLWLARRSCYVMLQPERAAKAGIWYCAMMMLGMFLVYAAGALSVLSALLIVGLASATAGWALTKGLSTSASRQHDALKIDVWAAHRGYGIWASSTNVMMWVPGNLYMLCLPIWLGIEAAGALKALLSLIMPAQQAFAAIGTILVPLLVTLRTQPTYRWTLNIALATLVGIGLSYWLILAIFGKTIVTSLYMAKYDAYTEVVGILGLLPILTGITTVFGSALRARERPDSSFWAYTSASIVTVSVGLFLSVRWGLLGAAIGLVTAYCATAIVLWRCHTVLGPLPVAHTCVAPGPVLSTIGSTAGKHT